MHIGMLEMVDSVELPDSDAELSDSDAESEFASEMEMADSIELPDYIEESEFPNAMEITVQSDAIHNYVLLVYDDNIVEDVLVKILGYDRAGRAPEPRLFFNDLELEKQKTLAECGIEPDSMLHLRCTPRVLVQADHDATEIAEMDSAEPSSSMRPNGDDEMKIYVQSEYYGNFALEVDSSNTIQDVLVTVRPIWAVRMSPEPKLYFNGHLLETAKSLADYSIQDGSILHLNWKCFCDPDPDPDPIGLGERILLVSDERQWRRRIPARDRIMITDQPLAIWEKEHDKVLLSLLVEQISNGGRKILLCHGKDSWCNIVAKFNELTSLKHEYKHLYGRFEFYGREYKIVNRIRRHPKFSWDHQRQVVIATDAEWNEYIKKLCPDARHYRRRAIPYIDLLETIFADKKEPEITQ